MGSPVGSLDGRQAQTRRGSNDPSFNGPQYIVGIPRLIPICSILTPIMLSNRMDMKLCSKCRVVQPLSEFSPRKHKGKYYPERVRKSQLWASWCKNCYRVFALKRHHKNAKYKKERFAAIRLEMICAYGGKCVCCGEQEPRFLTLEHKLGDGYKDKRENMTSLRRYRHLQQQGYPKDRYTLLCMNCNFATRFGKLCPHGNYQQLVASRVRSSSERAKAGFQQETAGDPLWNPRAKVSFHDGKEGTSPAMVQGSFDERWRDS